MDISDFTVDAVLVAWGSLGQTVDAIESVGRSTLAVRTVICVAQELPHDHLKALRTALGESGDLVVLDDNIGFASAVNLGIDRAIANDATHVLVLNNDAWIAPECVRRCCEEISAREGIAVVGPAVAFANRPGRLWFAGSSVGHWLAIPWPRGHFANAANPPPSANTAFVPGCCALISTRAFEDVGPFRDDYFMYFEDVEWGERARAQGWQLRYLGEVLCHHVMAGSSEEVGSRYLGESAAYYLARNPVLFARATRGSLLRATRTAGLTLVWGAYNLTRMRAFSTPGVLRAYIAGVADGFANRTGRRELARQFVDKRNA